MKRHTVLTVCFSLIFLNSFYHVIESRQVPRVINGQQSHPDKWRYMGALYREHFDDIDQTEKLSFFCGSVVWNEEYILSAAHCFHNFIKSPSEISVYLGHSDRSSLIENFLFKVNQIIVHEDYDDLTVTNDIALIRLASPIDFSLTGKQIIPVPRPESLYRLCRSRCRVIGWGSTGVDTRSVLKLREAVVFTESCDPQCTSGPGRIKAGDHLAEKDACNGDSGGSLICPLEDDPQRYSLVGLTSYGDNCSEGIEHWGTYTFVEHYLEWIAQQTGEPVVKVTKSFPEMHNSPQTLKSILRFSQSYLPESMFVLQFHLLVVFVLFVSIFIFVLVIVKLRQVKSHKQFQAMYIPM